MRARFSRSIGLPVVDEELGEQLGMIAGILIQPDTGVIEGFFVRVPAGLMSHQNLFLMSADIRHWGVRIIVRDADVISSIDDVIRLQSLLGDDRPVIGQAIVTESGRVLGRCSDVQFSTTDFRLEWLFPKRFFRWGIPLPASAILEIRSDAIVVRDAVVPEKKDPLTIVPTMPEAA